MEWQPIETAPTSGEVLVYDKFWDEVVAVSVSLIRGNRYFSPLLGGRDPDSVDDATHWMPLPTPPSPSPSPIP